MPELSPAAAFALRMGIDLAAMTLLVFGMYYRRYRDKELATAASMFNIFTFAVLSILSSVEFSVAAGFGLFAILALFSLRSEQITKIEITYFFGAIAIAVITSVNGTSLALVLAVVAVVLLAAFIIDHPAMLKSVASAKLTLDRIEPHILADPTRMRADLTERLGVQVMTFQIV
jgi:hypothetical protein